MRYFLNYQHLPKGAVAQLTKAPPWKCKLPMWADLRCFRTSGTS